MDYCKSCEKESDGLMKSISLGKKTIDNLGLCPSCVSKYYKYKPSMNIFDLEFSLRRKAPFFVRWYNIIKRGWRS